MAYVGDPLVTQTPFRLLLDNYSMILAPEYHTDEAALEACVSELWPSFTQMTGIVSKHHDADLIIIYTAIVLIMIGKRVNTSSRLSWLWDLDAMLTI